MSRSNHREENWPWKMVWKTKIPYKVDYFIWLLAKESVLTHDNLNKGKFQLCSRCFFYGEQVETISHLFLLCKWTEQLWRMFINLRKINWVKPGSIRGVLNSWNGDGNAAAKEERWKIVSACIWWIVWKERNQRCFEDKQNGLQSFKMNCLVLFYFWCKENILVQAEDIWDGLDYL